MKRFGAISLRVVDAVDQGQATSERAKQKIGLRVLSRHRPAAQVIGLEIVLSSRLLDWTSRIGHKSVFFAWYSQYLPPP